VLPSETAQKMVVSRIPLPLNNVSSSGIAVLYGPWFTNVPRICETPGVFHIRTGDKPGDTRGPERNRYCHSVFITLQASNRLPLSLVLLVAVIPRSRVPLVLIAMNRAFPRKRRTFRLAV
jgi:hypothetical protein